MLAIKTLYHTICTALTEINAPRIPVKPHMNTVKCKISRFLFGLTGSFVIILVLFEVDSSPINRSIWWALVPLRGAERRLLVKTFLRIG
ncbi:hypothetical protein D3C86_889210 [compost metagenome]